MTIAIVIGMSTTTKTREDERRDTMIKAIWVKCNGEAHSNKYQDHCPVCMPYWVYYPICPTCGIKPPQSHHGRIIVKCDMCGENIDVRRVK
jgi:hypothetical protein